ncbi:hypothetical protein B4U37_21665 (plasmid) [Sutcliffiella horikoshii]|uniref:Uncharacterized protein n=1 Tax=Sutcliffiella horikoshii TaxID=79883 RepID=A0ABN4ZPQ6_9BACI|nr:hypothetical protein [Sutcliffiella horikoshii]ART78722.1 hypothetical protein B4U37_21665 [Sutcliffiella horikoshii]
MSKVNDIKNKMRSQKQVTPTQVLNENVGEETNVEIKEEKKVERKRVSFDLRTDLHKELKMQSLLKEKNIYLLIEDALEQYLKEIK